MRLSNAELKEKYCTFWNDEKHDIGEVYYGDTPLIHYDEKEYEYFHTLTGTMANICAVEAYVYFQNGTYDLYRTLIGEVSISENGTVLCGDISVKYYGKTYDIILNEMYGLHSLTILRLGDKVKGFCNRDGQGSPANKYRTEELDDKTILKVLNVDLSDYGESIHKFIKACKDLYNKDNTNYIMDKCFNYEMF